MDQLDDSNQLTNLPTLLSIPWPMSFMCNGKANENTNKHPLVYTILSCFQRTSWNSVSRFTDMRIGSRCAVQYSAASVANVILLGYGADRILIWKKNYYGISVNVVLRYA